MDSSFLSSSPRCSASRRALVALLCCVGFASLGCESSLDVMTVGPGEITVTCNYGTSNTKCFEGYTSGTFVQAYYKLDGPPGNTCIVASPAAGGPVYWGDDCACDSSPGAGDCVGGNQCLVAGEVGRRTCSVSFCSSSVTLSVEAFGPGQVYDQYDPSSLRFFACGPDESCTRSFCADAGEVVQLEARSSWGARFLGWEGDCDENGYVTMDADRSCTARFEQPQLTVTVIGSGTVTSRPGIESCRVGDPDLSCRRPIALGTAVALNALPDPSATFIGWGGDCSGTDSSVSLEVGGSLSCTAEFSVVLGQAGVVDILTVDVDGSLLPDGIGYGTAASALDASSDLGVVSFDDPLGRGLVRDRRSNTTREIRPPRVETYTADQPISLSADGRAAAHQQGLAFEGYWMTQQVYLSDLRADPQEPAEQISFYDPESGFGSNPTGGGYRPALSGNGRYLAYVTEIPWVQGDPNPDWGTRSGIAVYDSCAGAPPQPACTPGPTGLTYGEDGYALDQVASNVRPAISPDGRFVLYGGFTPDYLLGSILYLHDRDTDDDGVYDEEGATSTVVAVSGGLDLWFDHGPFFLAGGGRYVGFRSTDPTLPGNENPPTSGRAYLRDTCAGAPAGCTPADHLVSVQADGQPTSAQPYDFYTYLTDVSSSGRYVVLASEDRRLFQTNPITYDGGIFVVRDTCIGAPVGCVPSNRLVSRRTNGLLVRSYGIPAARVSDDGTLAAFVGPRNALIPGADILNDVLLSLTGSLPDPGGVPQITGGHPRIAPVRSEPFLVTVRGNRFVPGAKVRVGGAERTTIFVSEHKLQAWFEAADLTASGVLLLTVANPGGSVSNPMTFTVD